MTSTERGKYCNSCQKAVTDFSSLTDKEIFNYISQQGGKRLCGRFTKEQVSRDLYPEYKQSSYSSMLKVAASIFLGALSSLPAQSQEQDSIAFESSLSQSLAVSRQIRIKGYVTSASNGEAISGATISILSLDSTKSDSNGYFELDIMTSLDSIELLIEADAWETKRSPVQLRQLLLGHCSVLEKDLIVEKKAPEFQWNNLIGDSEKNSAQQPNIIDIEEIADIMGNFIVTGTPIKYHTCPSEPHPDVAHTPLSLRVLNAFQPNCRPSPPPEPEYYVKNTPKAWGNEKGEPTKPAPSIPMNNKEAVLLKTQNENEEKTKESK